VLHVDHVIVADRIDLVSGDIGPHMRRDEIQHLGRKTAGDAHFFDLFGGFDVDGHSRVSALVRGNHNTRDARLKASSAPEMGPRSRISI